MDSYYLTKDAEKWLKENEIMYVGAIQKQRFNRITVIRISDVWTNIKISITCVCKVF